MVAATIAAGLVGLTVQFAALFRMGKRRPIGDEWAYLERGRSDDPFAPRLFLLPPVLPLLSRLCHLGSGPWKRDLGEGLLRLLMAVVSVLTVVLTAIAGWRLGGPSVALLGGILLAVHPERIVLGCHIWPDTLLAATIAALMVFSTLPEGPYEALLAGALCAVGVMVRIDFLIVPPIFFVAWSEASGPPTVIATAALLSPPVLALFLVSVHNYRRYGIPLPDTTWAFNLLVARSDVRSEGDHRFEIEHTVQNALETWRDLAPMDAAHSGLRALRDIFRVPLRFGRGIIRRLLILAGPDTFIRQKLLPAEAAYPDLGTRQRRWWENSLVIATPLLVAISLTGAAAECGLPGSFAWPSIGLATVAILFHTRTRYRVAVLPALSLVAAQAIVGLRSQLENTLAIALFSAAGVALFWTLLRIRYPDDLRNHTLRR